MDPVLALAIVSFGAFLIVLVTAIFYVFSVRPILLESPPVAASEVLDEDLRDELAGQRAAIEHLSTALAHHTEQLASAVSARPAPDEAYMGLQGILNAQSDTAGSLLRLVNEQTTKLTGFDERLNSQDAKLNRLANAVESRLNNLPSAPGYESLNALIQAQSERLVGISARLEQWTTPGSRGDEKLAEHARILAELDRELAAQAQVIQKLDVKVNEHTTMLVTAAAERREQGGRLERLLQQVGLMVPLLNRFVGMPLHHGQDRLTDIKGIGPVYASKLYEADIHTFRQLAALTPEEIYPLLNLPEWRKQAVHAQDWIDQARTLASQREKAESVP